MLLPIVPLFLVFSYVSAKAELKFAKPELPIDSSAQYRSVHLPKVFGGGVVEKPLKTTGGRQRFYKPTNKTDCPMSPYATYLNESDQADLYQLVKSARDDNVDEADIKGLMEEYMRNSLPPARFRKFQRENAAFEARLTRRQLRERRGVPRLYEKQRPKAVPVKDKRHLFDLINDPGRNEKSRAIRPAVV